MLPSWGFQSYFREVSRQTLPLMEGHVTTGVFLGYDMRSWFWDWIDVAKHVCWRIFVKGTFLWHKKRPKNTHRTLVWAHSDSNVLCLESFNHDSAPANLGKILAFYKQNTAHMTLLIQKILIYSSCAIEPYIKQRWFYHTLMLNAPFCKWFWSGFWVPKHRASQGIWSTRDR